eukprot:6734548-Prymnesium_polylepis.1
MKDPLPSPSSILLSLQQIAAFSVDADGNNPTGLAAEKSGFRNDRTNCKLRHCHNCDGNDHQGFECPADKADCTVCGIAAQATSTSTASR